MVNYNTIVAELKGQVATLWLARPEVHNALNNLMIREISAFFMKIEENSEIRLIVIRGRGKSFCSGADLTWMKQAFNLTPEENLKESKELSDLFALIFNSSKIVIALAHGHVYGGGNGLVAVCDLAYGLADARFSLSETRIGMAAASITPYLLNKVRSSDLKELIFTAKTFDGNEAVEYGLLNKSFISLEVMDLHLNGIIEEMLSNGKQAQIESKRLINRLTEKSMAGVMDEIPELLARIRISPEAQEGFSAFLEKRKARW